MKAALIQVRVEDAVKRQADELFTGLGLDTATAVRLFLVQAIQTGGLPFDVKRRPAYNAETEAALEEARAIAAGELPAESFGSFKSYRDSIGV
jgi:DNA-damage-inducible protein J